MRKLPIDREYKVYKNGTIVYDFWDEKEHDYPQLDTPMAISDGLIMYIQTSDKKNMFGCHILTHETDIDKAQALLDEDLVSGDVVFDSKKDTFESLMTATYIVVGEAVTQSRDVLEIVCRSTKLFMENTDNKSEKYKIWSNTGSSIKIFQASDEFLKDVNDKYPGKIIKNINRNSEKYGNILSFVTNLDFISELPDVNGLKCLN